MVSYNALGSHSPQSVITPLLVNDELSKTPNILSPTKRAIVADEEVGSSGSSNDLSEEVVHVHHAHTISQTQAFTNFLKAYLGTGMIGLPYAVSLVGVWGGIAGLVLIAFLSNVTMKMLVQLRQHLGVEEYREVCFKSLGVFGRVLCDFALATSLLGVSTVYLIFIATNVQYLIGVDGIKVYCVIAAAALLGGLCLFRSLKPLAFTSLLGNAVIILLTLWVIGFGLSDTKTWLPNLQTIRQFEVSTMPIFFGISVFACTCHNVVLSIERSMKDTSKAYRTLDYTSLTGGFIYMLFGIGGYMFFGDDTDPDLTNNIPEGIFRTGFKILLTISLFFSYPVQMFPLLQLMERQVLDRFYPQNEIRSQNLLRLSLVAVTAVLAVSVPLFGDFMSFVGAFSLAISAFILPPMCYLRVFPGISPRPFEAKSPDEYVGGVTLVSDPVNLSPMPGSTSKVKANLLRAKAATIVVFGLASIFVACSFSVQQIMKHMEEL